jgi:nitrate/TMAO reductase-like tetraheme cytochrome c subunit
VVAGDPAWGHKILGTINTPEKFEQHRLDAMKATNSRECRGCHNESAVDVH